MAANRQETTGYKNGDTASSGSAASASLGLREQCSCVQQKILAASEELRPVRSSLSSAAVTIADSAMESAGAAGPSAPYAPVRLRAGTSFEGSARAAQERARMAMMPVQLRGTSVSHDEREEMLLSDESSLSGDEKADSDFDEGEQVGVEQEAETCSDGKLLPPPRELFDFNAIEADPLEVPAKTGTGRELLYPPPRHIREDNPPLEELKPRSDLKDLVAKMMALDAARLQQPSLSINRIVYDSHDPIDLSTSLFATSSALNKIHPPPSPTSPRGQLPPSLSRLRANEQRGGGDGSGGQGGQGGQGGEGDGNGGAGASVAQSLGGAGDEGANGDLACGGNNDCGRAGEGTNCQLLQTLDSVLGGEEEENMNGDAVEGVGGGAGEGGEGITVEAGDQSFGVCGSASAAAEAGASNTQAPSEAPLVFESRFETGNLRRAVQVSADEYDLVLSADLNTRGNTQWFYFGVANTVGGRRYKFNIINCVKPDSLFNSGMLPLVYSSIDAETLGVGWRRRGEDVCYYQNHIRRRNGFYYTCSFTLYVEHSDDVLYLAYCHPFTLTDLKVYINRLEADPSASRRFRRRPLCLSLAGNPIELLTITSFPAEPSELARRKGIVISARVHPGESNSSHMMEGIIDYLVGPSLDAKVLRDNFVFKVIPILNPDGVVVGNYRCSLAGIDLNRVWKDPSKILAPAIFHAKQMLKRFMEDREVVLFCDLHGHSRKHNVFCYGCEEKGPDALRLGEMVFPRMLERVSGSFSFANCSFKVQRSKESTARVVVGRELKIKNSLTMEASFAGSNCGSEAGFHFGAKELREIGASFCDTLIDYFDTSLHVRAEVYAELQTLFPPGVTHDGGDSVGSDDNPSEDCADLKDIARRMARRVKASSSRRRKRAEATVSLAVGGATGQRAEQRAAVLAGAKRGTQSSAPLKTAPTAKDAAKKPVPPMRARSKSHSASQQSSSANANPSANGNGGGGGGGGAGSAGGVGGVGGTPYDAAGSQAGTRGLDSSNETLLARRSLRNSRAAPSQGRGPIARRRSLTPSVVGSPIGGAGCTVAGTGCGACTSPCGSACQGAYGFGGGDGGGCSCYSRPGSASMRAQGIGAGGCRYCNSGVGPSNGGVRGPTSPVSTLNYSSLIFGDEQVACSQRSGCICADIVNSAEAMRAERVRPTLQHVMSGEAQPSSLSIVAIPLGSSGPSSQSASGRASPAPGTPTGASMGGFYGEGSGGACAARADARRSGAGVLTRLATDAAAGPPAFPPARLMRESPRTDRSEKPEHADRAERVELSREGNASPHVARASMPPPLLPRGSYENLVEALSPSGQKEPQRDYTNPMAAMHPGPKGGAGGQRLKSQPRAAAPGTLLARQPYARAEADDAHGNACPDAPSKTSAQATSGGLQKRRVGEVSAAGACAPARTHSKSGSGEQVLNRRPGPRART